MKVLISSVTAIVVAVVVFVMYVSGFNHGYSVGLKASTRTVDQARVQYAQQQRQDTVS